eukprot:CAMPEP_0172540566 /NCGR_PEP_ID=MMETSP1067-20121228/11553_1 /TAXON_ID=265564 ORGANISM="Thalassiosira punctigera, Strain Tpunct2005C2" /NCGR_SAMPLE_ID=MMETSP1067 /ASSEMBLY_ACC=CAM_ASM_000444 /LENGTH=68 /DNA_ID=CAMNT_0013326447 /DNA_START=99 /DNA_END=305 /DNA_ORIENTATION=+
MALALRLLASISPLLQPLLKPLGYRLEFAPLVAELGSALAGDASGLSRKMEELGGTDDDESRTKNYGV